MPPERFRPPPALSSDFCGELPRPPLDPRGFRVNGTTTRENPNVSASWLVRSPRYNPGNESDWGTRNDINIFDIHGGNIPGKVDAWPTYQSIYWSLVRILKSGVCISRGAQNVSNSSLAKTYSKQEHTQTFSIFRQDRRSVVAVTSQIPLTQ